MSISCSSVRHIPDNSALLTKNTIEFKDALGFDNAINYRNEAITLLKQKNNRSLFFMGRDWLHYRIARFKNKESWKYRVLSKYAEEPAILDSLKCEATITNMNNYFYNKGYFHTKTSYKINTRHKKAKATYSIFLGKRYLVDSLRFIAKDSVIQQVLNAHARESFLYPNAPIDNGLFQKEKSRITSVILNHGFAEFNPLYIQDLLLDTVNSKNIVSIIINNPANGIHKTYLNGNIVIYPEYRPDIPKSDYLKDTVNQHIFSYYYPEYYIKPKVISTRIHTHPDSLYQKQLIDKTYKELTDLNVFKFVSIEPKISDLDSRILNYNIYLTPQKRWIFDNGIDVDYTNLQLSTERNLFGLSYFFNLRNRNLFHGAESFNSKLIFGTEINFKRINSLLINFTNDLSLPECKDLTGSLRAYRFFDRDANFNSRTNFRISPEYNLLFDFYKYFAINTDISYDFLVSRRKRITLKTFGLSLYLPTVLNDSIFRENKLLESSFTGNRLFSSIFLKELGYYYQSNAKKGKYHTFIGGAEFSGLETSLINGFKTKFTTSEGVLKLGSLSFSSFTRLEGDYRYFIPFGQYSSVTFRANAGIAIPFGQDKTIPYVKQFYLGGPQSMRGWDVRELGPGASKQSKDIPSNQAFYSTGDVKLEANAEFRFNIVWIFRGAVFLDAGNIWVLPNSQSDKTAELSTNAYQQIAVNTGFGLRMDLSYFVFRTDFGYKLRNPYLDDNNNYWIYNKHYPFKLKSLYKDANIHLAVNYPF